MGSNQLDSTPAIQQDALTDEELLTEVQSRACRFFWHKADPNTGLVNDRAANHTDDNYTVASMASTGYGLTALPIAVEHGWVTPQMARDRAEKTL